ncbi:hypothetical protein BC834DRAFT_845330 [Gloeopeniophorella convolvens]|nr:hypothetical protein BC834DRAFT_845330 [Gloeopeniophorella convolvens]
MSNFKVPDLLRELESVHIARTRTAQQLKMEEGDAAAATGEPPQNDPEPQIAVSADLRTVGDEPTRMRSPGAIHYFTRGLASFRLTKAGKLQIVNFTPVSEPVELYAIGEELEDRLGGKMDEVLDIVPSSPCAGSTVHRAIRTRTSRDRRRDALGGLRGGWDGMGWDESKT